MSFFLPIIVSKLFFTIEDQRGELYANVPLVAHYASKFLNSKLGDSRGVIDNRTWALTYSHNTLLQASLWDRMETNVYLLRRSIQVFRVFFWQFLNWMVRWAGWKGYIISAFLLLSATYMCCNKNDAKLHYYIFLSKSLTSHLTLFF